MDIINTRSVDEQHTHISTSYFWLFCSQEAPERSENNSYDKLIEQNGQRKGRKGFEGGGGGGGVGQRWYLDILFKIDSNINTL